MATTSSSGTTGSEMIKKIIIGVVSTVAAAVIIYYIIENKKGDPEKKEATIRAWNSYKQNNKIFSTMMKKIGAEMQSGSVDNDAENQINNALREIDLSIANMENIKTESKADNRVFSIVDIKTKQIQDFKTTLNDLFDRIAATMPENPTIQEAQNIAAPLIQEFANRIQQIAERDKIRLTSFKEELCKEYGDVLCGD